MTDFSDTPTREQTRSLPTLPTHPPAARCADPLCLWCEAWQWWGGWPAPNPVDESKQRLVDEDHRPMADVGNLRTHHWWWACQWPERKFVQGRTGFSMSCRGCVLALGAVAVNRPDEVVLCFDLPEYPEGALVPCSSAYEVLRERHELPVLRIAGDGAFDRGFEL